jgi:hypothetical protein
MSTAFAFTELKQATVITLDPVLMYVRASFAAPMPLPAVCQSAASLHACLQNGNDRDAHGGEPGCGQKLDRGSAESRRKRTIHSLRSVLLPHTLFFASRYNDEVDADGDAAAEFTESTARAPPLSSPFVDRASHPLNSFRLDLLE